MDGRLDSKDRPALEREAKAVFAGNRSRRARYGDSFQLRSFDGAWFKDGPALSANFITGTFSIDAPAGPQLYALRGDSCVRVDAGF